ncbi:hypothetical protein CANMA_002351 [Candida margitis]|uniref:uncharacterized protein n=1 Tax=Candida margitis TaxID=1775924 RepID=UPI0022264F35|nr:uncharacterized protein CANMA_002351 [Candida margitis]KAI5968606.1 hypothetical protein CANMA_002351 [Candida margitis]
MPATAQQVLEKQENLKSSNYLLYELNKLYYIYFYSTPLPYSTLGEAIVFNSIIISLATLIIYYAIFILPFQLLQSSEKVYYYMTGHSITFDVLQIIHTIFYLNGDNSTFVINSWSDLPKIIRI